MCQEMEKRGFSPTETEAVRNQAAKAVYEDPAHCANVFVDDVNAREENGIHAFIRGNG